MNANAPTLEVNVHTGQISAVAVLTFTTGLVTITTDARWCDKAIVFAALESTLRTVSHGASLPVTRVTGAWRKDGTRPTAAQVARKLFEGQDQGALRFVREWSLGYQETVSALNAPVTDMDKAVHPFFAR